MTGKWIVIPKWEKFQHYADRAPIWIKVQTDLNRTDKWRRLSMAERGLVVCLWIEYAASNGLLRTSDVPGRIGQKIPSRTWDAIWDAGFVEFTASRPQALRSQDASSRARARGRAVARGREEIEDPLPLAERGGTTSTSSTIKCRRCGEPVQPRSTCSSCGASPRVAGTNGRALDKPTAYARAAAFTRNVGTAYALVDFTAELDRFDLTPEQRAELEQLREQLAGDVLPELF